MSDAFTLLHLYRAPRAALPYPRKSASSVFAWRSMFKLFTRDVTCSPNHFVYSFMKTSTALVISEFQNFVAGTLNLGSELHPHPHANTRACTCTSVPTCRAAGAGAVLRYAAGGCAGNALIHQCASDAPMCQGADISTCHGQRTNIPSQPPPCQRANVHVPDTYIPVQLWTPRVINVL